MVVELFGQRISQPREPAHFDPHGQVLPFRDKTSS
jgi:hypothetical protein